MELLRQVGFSFTACKSGFPEVSLQDPVRTVEENARGKALVVAGSADTVTLAADTVVYVPKERVLGQARSPADVRWMLRLLRGRWHEVYSGVAVVSGDHVQVEHAVTRVRMREIEEEELEVYSRMGDGLGKAGGYAIQGQAAVFVEEIQGDYSNVVGLPLALTSRMLKNFGIRWYSTATP